MLSKARLEVFHNPNLHEVTGFKYKLTLSIQVGWYLATSLSVNLTVYLTYGFMATSKPQKNVINKYWYSQLIILFLTSCCGLLKYQYTDQHSSTSAGARLVS